MNKSNLILIVTTVVIVSSIIAGIVFLQLGGNEGAGKLHTFPLAIEEQIYVVTVRSNYTAEPEVGYNGLLKSVGVTFRGDPENAFCNITIPNNLIWGELSVYSKGYEMSVADYSLSSNSTHNSIYFTFNLPALTKDFSVKGTEGVME